MRLVQSLQQKYTQHMNTITAQMNRDVGEVQQQIIICNSKSATLKQTHVKQQTH